MLKPILFLMLLFPNILLSEAMHFTVETDYMNHRAMIYASGEIEHGTALKLIHLIKEKNIGNAIVYFNSYGGSLEEGMIIGRIIREMRYATSIGTTGDRMSGTCASACSYAFAGGASRYIYNDRQRLGLHQFYNENGRNFGSIAQTQQTTADIVKYLSDMGIDERAFVVASKTDKNSVTWLSKAEALKLNFANNGKTETTAEIKITYGPNNKQYPYLRIEQERAGGIGKLLFYCKDHTMYVDGMILTNVENSIRQSQNSKRNYFELSDGMFLPQYGQNGIRADHGSLFISRKLSDMDIQKILNSNVMNMWTEDGGNFRWGLELDIYPVKEKMREFLTGCGTPELDMDTTLSLF